MTSPTVVTAWKLDLFEDMVTVDEATLDKLPLGRDLPGTPLLVSTDDAKVGIQLVDGPLHRHIQNPESLLAWRFTAADVTKWTTDKYAVLKPAPDWRLRPFLVKGSSSAVYLLDDRTSEDPSGPADGGIDDGGASDAGRRDGGEGGLEELTSSSGGCTTSSRSPSVPLAGSFVLVAIAAASSRRVRRNEKLSQ